jgi:AbrB family looped-hinge helix DNA binding protein
MARVTSKLQVTIPKDLADQYGIKPGDEIELRAAGDSIRMFPRHFVEESPLSVEERLKMFDASVERQRERERLRGPQPQSEDRGWKREDLYDRGRTR